MMHLSAASLLFLAGVPALAHPLSDGSAETKNPPGKGTANNFAGFQSNTNDVSSVYGTFKVPTIKMPKGGSASTLYAINFIVAVGGNQSPCGYVEAGINAQIQNGVIQYAAFTASEAEGQSNTDLTVAPGDSVELLVHAVNTTYATATIQNLSKGTSTSQIFPAESDLCLTTASWSSLDNVESATGGAPIANYGTWTIPKLGLSTTSGGTIGNSQNYLFNQVDTNGNTQQKAAFSQGKLTTTFVAAI